jgi:hypothetical protein
VRHRDLGDPAYSAIPRLEPYVITNPTDSAFVPNSMLSSYTGMLKKQQDTGKYTAPALRADSGIPGCRRAVSHLTTASSKA